MASEQIGLIVGVDTRTVYSLVNPEDDAELDSPHHLQLENVRGEPVRMVRLRRVDCHMPDDERMPVHCLDGGEMSLNDVAGIIIRWYVTESEVYHGPDILKGAI